MTIFLDMVKISTYMVITLGYLQKWLTYGSFAGKAMKFFIFCTNESIQDYIQLTTSRNQLASLKGVNIFTRLSPRIRVATVHHNTTENCKHMSGYDDL